MDKRTDEDELKGLEAEIDKAVEHLFVEKSKGVSKSSMAESAPLKSSLMPPKLEPSMHTPTLDSSRELSSLDLSMESTSLDLSRQAPAGEPPSLDLSSQTPASEPSPLDFSQELSFLEQSIKPAPKEPADEMERYFSDKSSFRTPPSPVPLTKSIEKMEAQLLSLEWEITEDKVKKTREEVEALRELLKQKTDIVSILSNMEKVLVRMSQHEDKIQPPWIKYLLDSKETIKLLMRKETEGEINIYKQLAQAGIEARFACLPGLKEVSPSPSVSSHERERVPFSVPEGIKIEETLNKMNLFSKMMDEILKKMDPYLSKAGELSQKLPEPAKESGARPVNITVFKLNDNLFGVESEKVFKLFKVPNNFQEKYSNQQNIRLKEFEVKLINLKKILSLRTREYKGEIKILMVRDNGEYKGFMVDDVLKKTSALSEKGEGQSEYFAGLVHSMYQERSVEIPILNLKKF